VSFLSLLWGYYVPLLIFIVGKLCVFFIFIVGILRAAFDLYCRETVCLFGSLLWGYYGPLLIFIVGKLFAFFGHYCGNTTGRF
jgi:hypothetical protein